ncbi:MAG: helix-turn-helix transcriptional regulator [Gaiellaceae bacterium]
MKGPPRRRILLSMEFRLATALPLFAIAEDMAIVAWNDAAEEMTGITAEEAVGEPCWAVLAGRNDAGGHVCHRACSRARLAREGWPVHTLEMHIRAANGRRRVAVDTISVVGDEKPVFFHLIRDAPLAVDGDTEQWLDLGPPPELTRRQLDVLQLLAEGLPARTIASQLGLTEATVRNHIRAILLELGAHSQLEAVFRARCHAIL